MEQEPSAWGVAKVFLDLLRASKVGRGNTGRVQETEVKR